jgi:hypothetical protein
MSLRTTTYLAIPLVLLLGLPIPGRADDRSDQIARQQKEIKELQKEVASLLQLVKQQAKQIAELSEVKRIQEELIRSKRQIDEVQKRLVAEQVKAAALQQRNQQLEADVRRLSRELARVGAGKPVVRTPRTPLAPGVSGEITRIERSGLVNLSIGSDAGLAKGQTLDIYRLGAKPLYLGVVEILDVQPRQAAGRIRRTTREAVKVGDRVGTLPAPDKKR